MQQIAQQRIEQINDTLAQAAIRHNSFLSGRLGSVFYYYHLYRVFEKREHEQKAEQLLEEVFERVNDGSPGLSGTNFASGGAGLGYVVNYLAREQFIQFEVDEEFDELDNYLFNAALVEIEKDCIDYLHGALGVLHYFLDRKPAPHIKEYIDVFVEKLCGRAVISEEGCWFRNYILKIEEKDQINFSLSHGLSGILLLLIKAVPVTRHKELAISTIQLGIRYILKHRIDVNFANDEYSAFPFSLDLHATEFSAPNRIAWCYGDLNQVLLLYRAGHLLRDNNLLDYADLVGTQSLLRKNATATMVWDSHFCHGSSGVAQFYRTLYKERGLPAYKQGYEYWIEQTILLLDHDLSKNKFAGKEHEYLEGLLGVGLTLLSYSSSKEIRWSQSLLL